MSYEDENIDTRQLYERFKYSLGHSETPFFDELELVDIFDYAGDIGDEYVRMEVLFYGVSRYPDSVKLRDRRALLYLDREENEDIVRQFVNDHAHSTPLSDIVRLEVAANGQETTAKDFEEFLQRYSTLSEEESIRFVQLTADIDYPWLVANFDQLRQRSDFLPVLLYEMMNEAEEHGDSDTMIAMANELTEIEPFNAGNWIGLLRGHAKAIASMAEQMDVEIEQFVKENLEIKTVAEHREAAESAFDYAKALAYDSPEDIYRISDTVYNIAPYLRESAMELVKSAMEANPDDANFPEILAGLTFQSGKKAEAFEILTKNLSRFPGNFALLRHLLMLDYSDCRPYILNYFAETVDMELKHYIELVEQLHFRGSYASLNDFLSVLSKFIDIPDDLYGIWVNCLFSLGRYEQAVERIAAMKSPQNMVLTLPGGASFAIAVVGSYMRTRHQILAEEFIAHTRPAFEHMIEMGPLSVRLCISSVLRFYDTVKRHPATDRFFWEVYDPFRLKSS